ncbi:MAG: sugar kinase [Pseudomonadota bacterium]
MAIERIVVVRRMTALEELIDKFQTKAQAKFYLQQAGQSFERVEQEHRTFQHALADVHRAIPKSMKHHTIDRSLLSDYRFNPDDLILTLGPDGLLVNVAKYLRGQPIIAVNPDPATVDGILLPTAVSQVATQIHAVKNGSAQLKHLTMAKVETDDGQQLLALNDFFVGAKTHVSARYRLAQGSVSERHSSSGIIVSTGVGSTGWMRSIYEGALRAGTGFGIPMSQSDYRPLPWDAQALLFAVREPFPSKQTQTELTFGQLGPGEQLVIESEMASNGVIFSDGVEADSLDFHAGRTATISIAEHSAVLTA